MHSMQTFDAIERSWAGDISRRQHGTPTFRDVGILGGTGIERDRSAGSTTAVRRRALQWRRLQRVDLCRQWIEAAVVRSAALLNGRDLALPGTHSPCHLLKAADVCFRPSLARTRVAAGAARWWPAWRTLATVQQRRARAGGGAPPRCREAQVSWPRAQRASWSDSSRLSERSERSERSEFRDAAARPSIAGKSALSADRRGEAPPPARARLCRTDRPPHRRQRTSAT